MNDGEDLAPLFRAVPLFQGLADEDLGSLASRGAVREFAAGTVLFREGDAADAFYVVLDGKIRIEIGSDLVSILERGQFFGEIALLDGKRRSGSARVTANAKLLLLPQHAFESFLESRPAQARRFLAALATYIRDRLLTTAPLPATANGPLAARLLVQGGEQTLVLGDPESLAHADPALRLFLRWVEVLPGAPSGTIRVARSICGSTARLAEYGAAGDLDLEAMIFVERSGGRVDDLFDGDGPVLDEIARYFATHIERVLRDHPEVVFLEMKAGEWPSSPGERPTPLKWSLAEIRGDAKEVPAAGGNRSLRLRQALAHDARIKIDWAVPAVLPGALPGAYQECSVIYRIGARIGRGQVRARPSHRPELPILRRVAVALTRDDLAIGAEAAVAARTPSLEETHWSMAAGVAKVAGRDTLKVLKRRRGFLAFWDGEAEVSQLGHTAVTREQLIQSLVDVVSSAELRTLGMHRSHADVFLTMQRVGSVLPEESVARWLTDARELLGDPSIALQAVYDELSTRIEAAVSARLAERPALASYVRFVESRCRHASAPLRDRAAFVCLVPAHDTRAEYALRRKEWSARYSRLRFLAPDDLHLTLAFLGRVPEGVPALAAEAARTIASEWALSGGGVHLFGKRHQYLAIRFAASEEQRFALRRIRFEASRSGGKPDGRMEAVPHLSLASFDRDDSLAVDEAERFLLEESIGGLEAATLRQVEVWERADATAGAERTWRRIEAR